MRTIPSTTSLLLFTVGGRRCALTCSDIVEIVPRILLSSLPESPPTLLGVANLRGDVVSVFDLRSRLAPEKAEGEHDYQHLIVLDAGGRKLAVAVDEVDDVVELAIDAISQPASLTGAAGPGVARIGERMVVILRAKDVLKLLQA